ncbi:ICOS ligand [Carlito syrichta]|uniref:ICOS ligand n=1 Tax=Carlito syrichta TaxID=1868482 RepID=A0A3Q0EFA9_CARSF|nr:ICOS ligand [Carlito syrichta]
MRLRSPGLFFLLLSGLQADIQEKEVRAMVGSDVVLSCMSPEGSSFDLDDLFVYWQISETTAVTYFLPENKSLSHVDSRYRDRAWLSQAGMRQGDFSLHLSNITPHDEQKFNCLVFRKSLKLNQVLKEVIRLHVAANYSMPVVSTPSSPSQDEELTFTCTSTNGYPRPNVYWINKTDNSLLDKALQNDTMTLNERGLYDVVSILRIPQTPNVNVGCCIENVLLHQNLTVSSQTETSPGTKDKVTENPDNSPKEKNVAVFSVLAVLCVLAAVAVGWICKGKCSRGGYTGAWASRRELELTAPHGGVYSSQTPIASLGHSSGCCDSRVARWRGCVLTVL